MIWKWTRHALIVEARKYETLRDFRVKSNGAYQAALKRDLLDEICGHMKPSKLGRPSKQPPANATPTPEP